MSAIAAAPLERDIRVISLIGVVHGTSHYYQLAFVTMLLIVREKAGLSFTDVGALGAIYYGVSGICQTLAGFAVDRFGARPILAAGLALAAIGLALTCSGRFVPDLCRHFGRRRHRQLCLPPRGFRPAEFVGESAAARQGVQHPRAGRFAGVGCRPDHLLPRRSRGAHGCCSHRRRAGPDPGRARPGPPPVLRRSPRRGSCRRRG